MKKKGKNEIYITYTHDYIRMDGACRKLRWLLAFTACDRLESGASWGGVLEKLEKPQEKTATAATATPGAVAAGQQLKPPMPDGQTK